MSGSEQIPEKAKCPDDVDVMFLSTGPAYRSIIVRLAAEEKGIKWKNYFIDILFSMAQYDAWYINLNPGAYSPTLLYNPRDENGRIIERNKPVCESLGMIKFIDKTFPGKRSLMDGVEGDPAMMARFEQIQQMHEAWDVEAFSYGHGVHTYWFMRNVQVDLNVYWKISKLMKIRRRYAGDEKWESFVDNKIKQNLDHFVPIAANPYLVFSKAKVEALEMCDTIEGWMASSGKEPGEVGQTLFCLGNSSVSLADVLMMCVFSRGEICDEFITEAKKDRPFVAAYISTMLKRPSIKAAGLFAPKIPQGKIFIGFLLLNFLLSQLLFWTYNLAAPSEYAVALALPSMLAFFGGVLLATCSFIKMKTWQARRYLARFTNTAGDSYQRMV